MDRLLSPKTKQVLLVLLAVGLVALAGCNTGGDGTPSVTSTDGESLNETTPGETTTPNETTPGETTTPNETTPQSDVDFDELAAGHDTQVESADSLTEGAQILEQYTVNGSQSVSTTEVVTYYDLAEQVGLETAAVSQSSSQGSLQQSSVKYTAGTETFQRTNSTQRQDAQYRYDQEPYNMSAQPTPINFTSVGWTTLYDNMNASLLADGTTEFQNETVQKYTASGRDRLPALSSGIGSSFSELETFNVTMLVTDDGLITRTTIRAAGTTVQGAELTLAYQYTVADLGATTVEKPDWTDNVNTTG